MFAFPKINQKFAHPYVIDTSVIYQHPRGPPYKPSLKWLAQKWLSKDIQIGDSMINESNKESIGHDSEEDARACAELLKLKMEKGQLSRHLSYQTNFLLSRARLWRIH
jgi:RNA exonuclease 1